MRHSKSTSSSFFGWLTLDKLIAIIVFIAIFTMAARIPTDTDSWWHLQAGRWIVENQTIPTTDPFSNTRFGEPWIDHGWLAQAVIYQFWDWFGYAGLVFLLASLVTAAFYFAWLQCREANLWLRAFIMILAAIASGIIWAVRPQMVSFLLTSVTAYILFRYKHGSRRIIWLLPLLMLLWVNIHGGFAIGFILMVAYLFGETANWIIDHWQNPGVSPERDVLQAMSPREIGLLAVVMLICFLLLPLNPNGFEMWNYPFRTVNIGILQDFIVEWQSPNFHEFYLHPFIWMLLAALTSFGLSGRRADFTDLTLVALFAYMSLLAVRNIPLFALITAPVIARYATFALARWLGPQAAKNRKSSQAKAAVFVNWALLIVVLLLAFVRISEPVTTAANEKFQAENLPMGAVDYLMAERPLGPIFNDYNWGGYLIWRLPEYPVFVDGRTDLYDDEFLTDYLKIDMAHESWNDKLTEHNIQLAIISVDSPLANAMQEAENWQEIYQDELSFIFQAQN
jgi:hypothetical protein